MNDLFSSSSFSFSRPAAGDEDPPLTTIPLSSLDLDPFLVNADSIKQDLQRLDALRLSLASSHEKSKTAHDSKAVKELRARMDSDMAEALDTAKIVKVRLEALDRHNAASSRVQGHGVGSSSEGTRTLVVNGLRKQLRQRIQEFNQLRERIREEYRETVGRRYFTVTGEFPDDKMLDAMISTGQSETFLQKAIQQQGRGNATNAIVEIQDRNDAIRGIQRNLKELNELFKDMAVLVESQGEEVEDIESQVKKASTDVRSGIGSIILARSYQKNTQKWIILTVTALTMLLVVLITVFVTR
ncbi:hypothetical protein MLD38_017614 [Melastoma candidum]|uniref:Uncharacterized protein n=1 Tax=Melastoma candidum TaxID=119954 RepID=A0ACB9QR95_9MYRT|nr:hypothetical protein MLD38_017614 [Melastoma candidum]